MKDTNTYICSGNLGHDPELIPLASGTELVTFSIAIALWVPKDSEESRTLWMHCKAWRGLANHIALTFVKGDKVLIQGEIEQEDWIDKQSGDKKSRMILSVREIGKITFNKMPL